MYELHLVFNQSTECTVLRFLYLTGRNAFLTMTSTYKCFSQWHEESSFQYTEYLICKFEHTCIIMYFIWSFIEEQPPSYESIFGKIKHAKETSDGNVGFAKAAMGILCASGENCELENTECNKITITSQITRIKKRYHIVWRGQFIKVHCDELTCLVLLFQWGARLCWGSQWPSRSPASSSVSIVFVFGLFS